MIQPLQVALKVMLFLKICFAWDQIFVDEKRKKVIGLDHVASLQWQVSKKLERVYFENGTWCGDSVYFGLQPHTGCPFFYPKAFNLVDAQYRPNQTTHHVD